MSTFAEQITDLDIPQSTAIEPPRIWWHNGVKPAKTPGNFYTKQSEFAVALGAPWTPEERFDNEPGFTTPGLRIAVLAWRQQPFRKYKDEQGRDRVEYALKWEEGMTIHTELLCLIEGYEDVVVWSAKGLTGSAITRRDFKVPAKSGWLRTYTDGLLKDASRIAKRGLPLYAFWLPIATKRADDKIAYEDTGYGSFVTPPALFLPPDPMDALFVGADILRRGADLLAEHAGWADRRRPVKGVVDAEYTVEEPRQIAAPARNAPQLVEEGDTY